MTQPTPETRGFLALLNWIILAVVAVVIVIAVVLIVFAVDGGVSGTGTGSARRERAPRQPV